MRDVDSEDTVTKLNNERGNVHCIGIDLSLDVDGDIVGRFNTVFGNWSILIYSSVLRYNHTPPSPFYVAYSQKNQPPPSIRIHSSTRHR